MAKRKASPPQSAATAVRVPVLTRRFLPSLDLVDAAALRVEELTDEDKRQVLGTKVTAGNARAHTGGVP